MGAEMGVEGGSGELGGSCEGWDLEGGRVYCLDSVVGLAETV